MKVILLQDIKGLGKKGDVRDVAEGYARNFLFVKNMAETATSGSVRRVETIRKKQVEKEQNDREKNQRLADQIKERKITLKMEENKGRLFGSVQAKDIVRELKKESIHISDKSVILKDPIRKTGSFEIKIRLDHGIETSIRISIEGL